MKRKVFKRGLCSVLVASMMIMPTNVIVRADDSEVVIAIEKSEQENSQTESVREFKERKREPLMGGYFRTWHDKKSTGDDGESHNSVNCMGDVPEEVDLLFVFHNFTADDSPFWDTLKNEYVPKLNKQGTKVIRTIGIDFLSGKKGLSANKEKYPRNEIGYKRLAKDIVETYVYKDGLNGLDIDLEIHNEPKTEEGFTQAIAVVKELGKLIGEHGKDNTKFLILDTTLHAFDRIQNETNMGCNNRIFVATHKCWDYVLVQAYGSKGENGVQGMFNKDYFWRSFRDYISSDQFLVGFTFYEENGNENGNQWHDTEGATIADTRAYRYANHEFEGGVKGGIFSYAIDRDGVVEGNNDRNIVTDYSWTKDLKHKMLEKKSEYEKITEADFPDSALRESIINQIGDYKGNISRYDREIVLDDENIESLEGLEKLTKISKLTLRGLNNVKELDEANLPKHLIENKNVEENKTNQYVEPEEKIIVSDLTGVETVKLAGCGLEYLPEDGMNWTNLKSFDISNNKLDLSENTTNGKIVKQWMEYIAVNNEDSANDSMVQLSNQRPNAYFPEAYEYNNKLIELKKEENTNIDLRKYLEIAGQKTAQDTYIQNEEGFDNFKESLIAGKEFVAADYEYEDFKIKYNKENYIIEVSDHTNKKLEEEEYTVPGSEDESYLIEFFEKVPIKSENGYIIDNKKGKKLHETQVVVGEAPESLEVISQNARIIVCDAYQGDDQIFDGITNKAAFGQGNGMININSVPQVVIFDIGTDKQPKQWTIYNASYSTTAYGERMTGYNTIKSKLEYWDSDNQEEVDEEELNTTTDNWKEADTIENFGEEDLHSHSLKIEDGKTPRYWKYTIIESKSYILIPELIIYGKSSNVSQNTSELDVEGKVGEKLAKGLYFDIDLIGDTFENIEANMDVTDYISPKIEGIKFIATIKGAEKQKLRVKVIGTPKESAEVGELEINIPQDDKEISVNAPVSFSIKDVERQPVVTTKGKTLTGFVGKDMMDYFEIEVNQGKFDYILEDMDVTSWVSPVIKNIKYTANVVEDGTNNKISVRISGKPEDIKEETVLHIQIPKFNVQNAKKDILASINPTLKIEVNYPPILQPYIIDTSLSNLSNASNSSNTSSSSTSEIKIEADKVPLSVNKEILFEQITKMLTQEEDKKLIRKLFDEKISEKEFIQKVSDQALNEYAVDIAKEFKDETSNKWYAKELSAIRLLQLVKGYDDGTFKAENKVTGKEFVTMLVRMNKLPLVENKTEKKDWFDPYKQSAEKAGLIKGVDFNLDKELTRQEVAFLAYNSFILNMKTQPQVKIDIRYTDKADIIDKYVTGVSYLSEHDILKGYVDGSFKPNTPVTRSEIVVILYRLLKK